jgi:hypothetical protein
MKEGARAGGEDMVVFQLTTTSLRMSPDSRYNFHYGSLALSLIRFGEFAGSMEPSA